MDIKKTLQFSRTATYYHGMRRGVCDFFRNLSTDRFWPFSACRDRLKTTLLGRLCTSRHMISLRLKSVVMQSLALFRLGEQKLIDVMLSSEE
ncbi:hypothetical protein D3C85_592120 [compost metagenome]|jgi:hypothetical protein